VSAIDDSIDARGGGQQSLVARVKGIIMQPKSEWHEIDGEATSVGQIFMGYVVPLSAIPPIAMFIGTAVLGVGIPLIGTFRIPVGMALESAITRYILGLVGVYVMALIIDALAPTFGGERSQVQALKVAAYASTAAWLAGIFAIIPMLGWLGLLALYSLYLLFLGLPIVMKSPAEKALGYTIVVIVCEIVIFVVIGGIANRFVAYPAMGVLR
jgi:hypothetical protein